MGKYASIKGVKQLERALENATNVAVGYGDNDSIKQFIEAVVGDEALVVEDEFIGFHEYSGSFTARVELVEDSPTRFRLVARGQNILFVEFGAGITYPFSERASELGFTPRSWSNTHSHYIRKDGTWIYHGVQGGDAVPTKVDRLGMRWLTYGNPGLGAMHHSALRIKHRIKSAFRHSFGRR